MDDAEADRNRVGDYVRRALPRAIERGGCDWPVRVEWDDVAVRAYLTRGALVLSTFYRRVPWWEPATRERGDAIVADLAAVLLKTWGRDYRDADETGRCQRVMWMDPEGGLHYERNGPGQAVTVTLEPGVRLAGANGQGGYLVYRHCVDYGVTYAEAVSIGWMDVE